MPWRRPRENTGRLRDTRDVWTDLCGNSYSKGRTTRNRRDIWRDRWDMSMGQTGHTHTRGCPAKILYVNWSFLCEWTDPAVSPRTAVKIPLAQTKTCRTFILEELPRPSNFTYIYKISGEINVWLITYFSCNPLHVEKLDLERRNFARDWRDWPLNRTIWGEIILGVITKTLCNEVPATT